MKIPLLAAIIAISIFLIIGIVMVILFGFIFVMGLWLMATAIKEAVLEIKAGNIIGGIVVFSFFFGIGLTCTGIPLTIIPELWFQFHLLGHH